VLSLEGLERILQLPAVAPPVVAGSRRSQTRRRSIAANADARSGVERTSEGFGSRERVERSHVDSSVAAVPLSSSRRLAATRRLGKMPYSSRNLSRRG
jgi:hypothetical protein